MIQSRHLWLALSLCFVAAPARAQTCPFAGEKTMLVVRLYFGQDIPGKGVVSAAQWRSFLARDVTPRFPDGFTVYDASGQWRDEKRHIVVREPSKIVEIAAPDSADMRRRVDAISERYKSAFHQQSVGIVSSTACGKF